MNRRIAITLVVTALAFAAASAQAGDRRHGSWGYSHGQPHGAQFHHQRGQRGWGSNRRHHRSHGRSHHRRSHYRHRRHDRHDALKFIAGAALLGTIVTTLDRPRPAGAVVNRRGYAARRPYAVQQNRWYQLDSYGDCFEVVLQRDGQQVWTRTHLSHCR